MVFAYLKLPSARDIDKTNSNANKLTTKVGICQALPSITELYNTAPVP